FTHETTRIAFSHGSVARCAAGAGTGSVRQPAEHQVVCEQLPVDLDTMAGYRHTALHGDARCDTRHRVRRLPADGVASRPGSHRDGPAATREGTLEAQPPDCHVVLRWSCR